MPTFTTPRPIAATVQVAGARVRVNASDRADTTVLVEPVDPTSHSDVRVADRTKVEFGAGQLSVKTTVSGDKDGSVVITIDLPTGSNLVVYLAHSTVDADGSFGECELHLAKGRVRLDRADAVQANIAAGELAIGRIAGPVQIEGSTAAIDIGRADGRVTARTADGAIRIGRLTHGPANLSNRSENIVVGIGDGTAVRVDADSKRGCVLNSVALQGDSASQASPSPYDAVAVHARTRYGDIVIQRAAG